MLWKLAAKCRGEDEDKDASQIVHGEVDENKKDDGFRPAKLFSIDRVFRNETMDATHLAEFHQVEGVVADRNLTLADLIGKYFKSDWVSQLIKFLGFMRVFFKKMGIENLRYKPAYNPYTEVNSFICLPCSLNLKVLLSLPLKSLLSIRFSTNGSKLETVECSVRRCWNLWVSLKMFTFTAGVLA